MLVERGSSPGWGGVQFAMLKFQFWTVAAGVRLKTLQTNLHSNKQFVIIQHSLISFQLDLSKLL